MKNTNAATTTTTPATPPPPSPTPTLATPTPTSQNYNSTKTPQQHVYRVTSEKPQLGDFVPSLDRWARVRGADLSEKNLGHQSPQGGRVAACQSPLHDRTGSADIETFHPHSLSPLPALPLSLHTVPPSRCSPSHLAGFPTEKWALHWFPLNMARFP